jgi:hypothetical protein
LPRPALNLLRASMPTNATGKELSYSHTFIHIEAAMEGMNLCLVCRPQHSKSMF